MAEARQVRCLLVMAIFCIYGVNVFAQSVADHYEQAEKLYDANERDSALIEVDLALSAAAATSDDSMLVRSYILKALIFSVIRSLPAADTIINKALVLSSQLPLDNIKIQIDALIQKAVLKVDQYQFDSCIYFIDRTLPKTNLADGYRKDFLLSTYAWCYLQKRDYAIALQYAKQSLNLANTHIDEDSTVLIRPLQTILNIFNYSSQFDSALIYARQYFRLTEKNSPAGHPNIGIAHNDLGTIYQNLRDYGAAMYHRKQCEDNFYKDYLENGQTRLISAAWANLGYLYSVMGDYAEAELYYQKGHRLSVAEYGKKNLIHITSLLQLGTLQTSLEEYKKADDYYTEALAIQKELGGRDEGSLMLINANILSNTALSGVPFDAESSFAKLMAYYQGNNLYDSKQMIGAKESLATWYRNNGQYTKSVKNLHDAEAIMSRLYLPKSQEIVNNFSKLARSYLYIDAIKSQHYQEMIIRFCSGDSSNVLLSGAFANSIIPELMQTRMMFLEHQQKGGRKVTDSLQMWMDDYISYLSTHVGNLRGDLSIHEFGKVNKRIFTTAIQILLAERSGKDANYVAFRWGDYYRALTLKIQANSVIGPTKPGDIDSISAEELGLRRQLQLAQLAYQEASDADLEALLAFSNAQDAYQRLKQRLHRNDQELYNKRFSLSNLPEEFRPNLFGVDRAVWQIVEADSTWFLFVTEGDDLHVRRVKADTLNILLDAYFAKSNQGVEQINKDIYALLLGDLITQIKSKIWTIIPDGRLFFLNIEQLQDEAGKYLIDDIQINYRYSASFEQTVRPLNSTSKIGAFSPGFSDELKGKYLTDTGQVSIDSSYLHYLRQPFMLQLVSDIARQYSSATFTNELATESNLRDNLHLFRVLHFGTHGELDDRNPLRSRLVFAKEQSDTMRQNDGYLHTYEIYGLNLPADLAILSACETALGDLVDGEGVVSIAHAFQYAGCPSMVTSLWQVDEKVSAQIIQSFYYYLAKKWNKAKALRQAKLDYLAAQTNSQLREPYYWAGLILMGDDNPIDLATPNRRIYILAGVFLMVVFGFFAWKRRGDPSSEARVL